MRGRDQRNSRVTDEVCSPMGRRRPGVQLITVDGPRPRLQTLAEEAHCFGSCRLDRAMGLLHVDGEEVWLPPKALALLEYLVERPSAVVSRDELLAAAWGESAVTDHSLTEAIRILRRALGDDPRRPRYIQTVHKRGYRLVAEVVLDERGLARVS